MLKHIFPTLFCVLMFLGMLGTVRPTMGDNPEWQALLMVYACIGYSAIGLTKWSFYKVYKESNGKT